MWSHLVRDIVDGLQCRKSIAHTHCRRRIQDVRDSIWVDENQCSLSPPGWCLKLAVNIQEYAAVDGTLPWPLDRIQRFDSLNVLPGALLFSSINVTVRLKRCTQVMQCLYAYQHRYQWSEPGCIADKLQLVRKGSNLIARTALTGTKDIILLPLKIWTRKSSANCLQTQWHNFADEPWRRRT